MKRESEEAYVKYGSKRAPALDDLSVGVWGCGIFEVPCVAAGIGNGRPFSAILSLIALISCGVAIEICKQKVKQWTYFQRFLLRGGYPLAMSVAILLMGLSVWESQMESALWCELVTLGIWLIGMGLYFYIPWRKANKGVYYQLSKVHRTNKWRMKRIMERKSVIAGGSGGLHGDEYCSCNLSAYEPRCYHCGGGCGHSLHLPDVWTEIMYHRGENSGKCCLHRRDQTPGHKR